MAEPRPDSVYPAPFSEAALKHREEIPQRTCLKIIEGFEVRRRLRVIEGGQPTAREQAGSSPRGRPAFEEVLLAQLDSLFAFGNRLVQGKREEAEELVQEACLRAFRKYDTLRAPEKFKAWLFQILVNTYINETHRHSRQPPIVDVELSEALLTSSEAQTPEQELLAKALDSEVQEALDALPIEFRTVVGSLMLKK